MRIVRGMLWYNFSVALVLQREVKRLPAVLFSNLQLELIGYILFYVRNIPTINQ